MASLLSTLFLGSLIASSFAQEKWCNKNYMKTQPIVPPGGQFPIPAASSSPLLALRCGQAVKPYLPEDIFPSADPTFVSILVDTPVTNDQIVGAKPVSLPGHGSAAALKVTAFIDGKVLVSGSVPLNATKHALPFSLNSQLLKARKGAFTLTCTATLGSQTFNSPPVPFTFLPTPDPKEIGSVTKMDMRSGGLLARSTSGHGAYIPVFPIGFYTNYGGYLVQNFTAIITELKAQGFNAIHPVPTFDDQFDAVVDEMEKQGMWLIYDMRGTYLNLTSVAQQVTSIKTRPNLLLWYTGDEPDGWGDPLNGTSLAYSTITGIDGGDGQGGTGYHPVSLVLNCENYEWIAYSSGADILLQDTYMIGNNVTHSTQWDTPCTPDYGDCGCDNCKGTFQDISTRMDEFAFRSWVEGTELAKSVWTVPQAFGDDTYWKREPTGQEFLVQAIVGINHGGLGVTPWVDPCPADIKSAASTLALALKDSMNAFILNPHSTFKPTTTSSLIDVGLWTTSGARLNFLVLAANTKYQPGQVSLTELGVPSHGSVEQVFSSGASLKGGVLSFESVGSGAWIIRQ